MSLETHVPLREETTAFTRLVGGDQQLLCLSGHFPYPLPARKNGRRKFKHCFMYSDTTQTEYIHATSVKIPKHLLDGHRCASFHLISRRSDLHRKFNPSVQWMNGQG
ncbi:hypothetical protein J6590_101871, partial [Homalodisca vitripennis]